MPVLCTAHAGYLACRAAAGQPFSEQRGMRAGEQATPPPLLRLRSVGRHGNTSAGQHAGYSDDTGHIAHVHARTAVAKRELRLKNLLFKTHY